MSDKSQSKSSGSFLKTISNDIKIALNDIWRGESMRTLRRDFIQLKELFL
jgi:hypothetical protein